MLANKLHGTLSHDESFGEARLRVMALYHSITSPVYHVEIPLLKLIFLPRISDSAALF